MMLNPLLEEAEFFTKPHQVLSTRNGWICSWNHCFLFGSFRESQEIAEVRGRGDWAPPGHSNMVQEQLLMTM
jgi:hypothetical protein